MGKNQSKHEHCAETFKKDVKELREEIQKHSNANQERMETCLGTIVTLVNDNEQNRIAAEKRFQREQEEAKNHCNQMERMIVELSVSRVQTREAFESMQEHTKNMMKDLADQMTENQNRSDEKFYTLLDRVLPSENNDVNRVPKTPQDICMNWIELSD